MEHTCENCGYMDTYAWVDDEVRIICDYYKGVVDGPACDHWKEKDEDKCKSCVHAVLEGIGESGKYTITNCEISHKRIDPNHASCHDFTRRDSIKIENKDARKLPDGGVEIKCKLADGERPDWFENMFGDKEKTEKEYDPVNSPKHYTSGKVECIDAMIETFGVEAVKHFCLCNAFKYHWRHELKNGDEDIKKATWYMDKYKELENI